jgi:hypothetical protein
MVKYKCPRCGEIFARNCRYDRHIKSKNICHPLLGDVIPEENNYIIVPNDIVCDYCNKQFADDFNLNRHLETCRKKKLVDDENKKKKLAEEEDEKNNISKKLDAMMNMITMLQHNQSLALVPAAPIPAQVPVAVQVSAPVAIDNSTNVGGDNISNVQNNVQSNSKNKINNNNQMTNLNVTFSYNNPDISHISDHDYKSCINSKLKSVPKLMTKIHFNPDKPENHNIYLENMDSNVVNVYDGKQWKQKNTDFFVEDAITINENMFERWVERKEDPVMQNALKRYYDLRDEEGMEERIQQDVLQTMFNNRKFAEKKFKEWKKEEARKEAEKAAARGSMEPREQKEQKEPLKIQM